jgi:Domain of unknown function (DUF4838)/Glycosyl hydrolases family 2, sugar binding domain
MKIYYCFIVFFLCFGIPAHLLKAMDIVRDGKPQATIVIPDAGSELVREAAGELQYHIQKATGAKLLIIKESFRPINKSCIFLGATKAAQEAGINTKKLEPNGFVIKLVGESFFMVGDDVSGRCGYRWNLRRKTKSPAKREKVFGSLHANWNRVGTLFAVYEFLEKHLSVRWLWPGKLGELIPKTRDIVIAKWNQTGKPALVHSRWRDSGHVNKKIGWKSPKAHMQFNENQSKWLRRHRFAMGVNQDRGHTFVRYWKKIGKSHPEYFNLLPNGTRRPDGYSGNVAMCVSQPKLWKEIIRKWQERYEPGQIIGATENDTNGKCTCSACMAWDEPDPALKFPYEQRLKYAKKAFDANEVEWESNLGSLSDRYCKYYLALQKAAEKIDPNAMLQGVAYANYVKPPLKAKLNKRIFIKNVPPYIINWKKETEQAFEKNWKGWEKTGCSQLLRPNYTFAGHNMPIAYARPFAKQFAFAAKHGMWGSDFDSLTGQYATQGPTLYVVARMNNNPKMPVSQILNEFYKGFGPASEAVKNYFKHWEQVSKPLTDQQLAAALNLKKRSLEPLPWRKFFLVAPKIFTPAVMAKGRNLLTQAKKAATGDTPALQRISFLEKGLRHAKLTLAAQLAYEAYRKSGKPLGASQAIRKLDAFRASAEFDGIANMGVLRYCEARTWPLSLLKTLTRNQSITTLPTVWKFMWDPDKQGLNKGWQADKFDDKKWHNINITTQWELQPLGKKWKAEHGTDYDGLAWYRTTFTVDPSASNKRVNLLFGAVDDSCVIWVNGEQVLDRPHSKNSWQESFEVDITKVVRLGKTNTLVVRVKDKECAGGIWKPVNLLVMKKDNFKKRLLTNPGFESNRKGWKRHDRLGKFKFEIDRTVAHTGRKSGRMTCTAFGSPQKQRRYRGRSWARWYREISVKPGRTYRFRVWAKTSVKFDGKVVALAVEPHKKTYTATTLNTNGNWIELRTPDFKAIGDKIVIYLISQNGLGTVWFDDAELSEKVSE